MGKLQEYLQTLLGGQKCGKARPTLEMLKSSGLIEDLQKVYSELGGRLNELPLRTGKWDFEVDGIAIEFDEQLHFNRYRATTLQSSIYLRLPGFPLAEYQRLCSDRESHCLKAGSYRGKWTKPSCEKQFGPGGSAGSLCTEGAPRWKQRAFYDMIKDTAPLTLDFPFARLSIWDTVFVGGQEELLKDILEKWEGGAIKRALRELMLRRVVRPYS